MLEKKQEDTSKTDNLKPRKEGGAGQILTTNLGMKIDDDQHPLKMTGRWPR